MIIKAAAPAGWSTTAKGATPSSCVCSSNPRAEKRAELEAKVKVLAIPRRLKDWADEGMVEWQRFRAGIEGTISVLKRAFRLATCLYRGFKSFSASVGMAIFCHNLVNLAPRQAAWPDGPTHPA